MHRRSSGRDRVVAFGCTAALLLILLPAVSVAAPLAMISGFLNDPGNPALIGSAAWTGSTPPAPLFADDLDVANNVALHTLSVATPGVINVLSSGFAAGGVDPYFTLFSGVGESATVVGSNFAQAFSTGGDFSLDLALAAGDYTLAVGAFANLSFAENLGGGALGDGFTGLGGPSFLGTSYYELVVSTTVTPVPQPSSLGLVAVAMGVLLLHLRRANRHPRTR